MAAIELGKYLRQAQEQYHGCIETCVECWVACEMCSDACLDEQNVEQLARCIRLDRDCAEACQMAVRVMVRGGDNVAEVCRMCAAICDRCAEECEKHAAHHEHCRICAEICRRCAEECRRMAA